MEELGEDVVGKQNEHMVWSSTERSNMQLKMWEAAEWEGEMTQRRKDSLMWKSEESEDF